MSDSLFFNLLSLAAGVYLLYLWLSDTKEGGKEPNSDLKGKLPGSSWTTLAPCLLATLGAVAIILIVSSLEFYYDVSSEQSTLSWWMLPAMMGAAITEEVVFRGYLIITKRGRLTLVISAIVFSALFALLHPYLWTHSVTSPMGIEWVTSLRLTLELQPVLATASIFALSLWFYRVRFWARNPSRSLLPCFCAHAGANLAVFIIKIVSGYVS